MLIEIRYNDNAFYVIESFVTQGINMSENRID